MAYTTLLLNWSYQPETGYSGTYQKLRIPTTTWVYIPLAGYKCHQLGEAIINYQQLGKIKLVYMKSTEYIDWVCRPSTRFAFHQLAIRRGAWGTLGPIKTKLFINQ